MQVQFHTNDSVEGHARLAGHAREVVERALAKYQRRITRVDVHLADENLDKGGVDKRCSIEARVAGMPPMAASNVAQDIGLAIEGAAEKLAKVLSSALGRIDEHRHALPRAAKGTAE